MWYIRKIDPSIILIKGKYVSLVGAGGKTSLAEYLADEALKRGKRVALTTTTRIWAKEPYVTLARGPWRKDVSGRLVRIGKSVEKEKLTGLEEEDLAAIGSEFDLVLIEADGAKGMPLKYPADFEPVIPSISERIVVLAGLDGLSSTMAETVFRWELFSEKSGLPGDTRITAPIFLRLFQPDALMKNVDPGKCIIILNKYDACEERQAPLSLARQVSEKTGCAPVVVASVRHGIFYGLEPLDAVKQ